MTKFNRNIDGFLPGHILLEMALRNPEMVSLTRTLFRTQELWAHSAARGNQLFGSVADFLERTGLPQRAVENLVEAGAFDSVRSDRRSLLQEARSTKSPAPVARSWSAPCR